MFSISLVSKLENRNYSVGKIYLRNFEVMFGYRNITNNKNFEFDFTIVDISCYN